MASLSRRKAPWGSWRVIFRGNDFQVKRLSISPGRRFSLQYHRYRSEHWVVVSGTGKATLGNQSKIVSSGRQLFVPVRAKHRLQNTGRVPLVVIEVQQGSYLGEDDIVRLQDDYHRT